MSTRRPWEKWCYALAMAAVLIVAAAIVLGTLQRQWAARRRSAPDIGGLAERLRETAEKKLAAPALASEQIRISAPRGEIEPRAKAVIDAAIGAGGTAVKTTAADGSAIVLARIPGRNAKLFRGLINQDIGVRQNEARADDTMTIEVLITPPGEQQQR